MDASPQWLHVQQFFGENTSITFVRCQWVEFSGILRTRVLTTSHFMGLVESSSPIAMSPIAMTAATLGGFMPDLIVTGVDHLYPDFWSLRPLLYAPESASVMCYVSEGIGNMGFRRCPRTILRNVAKSGEDLGIKVGFELEFRCFNPDGTSPEDCIASGSNSAAMRNLCWPIIEEIVKCLELSGIPVHQFHPEGTKGMFEISTGPLPIVRAVDDWIYTREAIKSMFFKHNVIATLHPSPTTEHHGIGAHFHVSIAASEATGDAFLAGILSRLPALCALSLPLETSYRRVNDFKSESGAWVAWGTQNRDVPIRKIEPGRWEVRCCDGAANMYLALAAFMAAGIHGAKAGSPLVWKDCFGCPSSESEVWRTAHGIVKKLPMNLTESLQAMKESNWKELGMEDAATTYVKIKERELITLPKLSEEDRRHIMIRNF
jgi:glutamine synthetase